MSSFSGELIAPTICEVTHDSVYIVWTPCLDSIAYQLDMKIIEHEADYIYKGDIVNDDDPDGRITNIEWKTLSSTLTSTSVRKKNLKNGREIFCYLFRYRSKDKNFPEEWSRFSQVVEARTLLPSTKITEAPSLLTKDSTSITVSWAEIPGAAGYKLRYRSDADHGHWTYVDAVIHGGRAKKKNLVAHTNYYFSIIPIMPDDSEHYSESPSSEPIQLFTLAPNLSTILPSELIAKSLRPKSADALSGKVIGLYFSGTTISIILSRAGHNLKALFPHHSTLVWTLSEFHSKARGIL